MEYPFDKKEAPATQKQQEISDLCDMFPNYDRNMIKLLYSQVGDMATTINSLLEMNAQRAFAEDREKNINKLIQNSRSNSTNDRHNTQEWDDDEWDSIDQHHSSNLRDQYKHSYSSVIIRENDVQQDDQEEADNSNDTDNHNDNNSKDEDKSLEALVNTNDENETPIHVPAELILMISCLLESAQDLLHLGLVCKRYYRLILENIHNPNHKESTKLLSKFLQEAVELKYIGDGNWHVHVYHYLPAYLGRIPIRGPQHGRRREYLMPGRMPGFDRFVESTEAEKMKAQCEEVGSLVRECWYYHNHMHGVETAYHNDSGKKSVIQSWMMGRLHGPSIRYYPNGNKETEMMFQGGRPAGDRIEYLQNGDKYKKA